MVLVGCAGRETGFQPERDDPAAAADLASYRAVFELAWNGAPVGEARERLDAVRGGGVRFERREVWQVRRAAALVRGELTVEIAATADLEPTRVEVGGSGATGTAVRQGDGWLVEVAGEPPRLARGMPVEILPLYLAYRGRDRWAGPVLFAGLGFAPAYARVLPDGEAHRLVEISGPAGKLAVRVSLEADGTVATAIGPDMSAHRVRAAALPRPPDLLALGAIDVAGAPGPEIELAAIDGRRRRLVASPPATGAPPAVPDPPATPALGALADHAAAGATSPADEIARLARATSRLLTADAARVASRGRTDCVGHAALFAALARARGHTVRLVTGYRLDGRRLVRHAWAIALLPGGTLAIDPTTGDAVDDRYFPLAVHGASIAEVALASELAYAGLTGARARFIAPRSARSTPRTP